MTPSSPSPRLPGAAASAWCVFPAQKRRRSHVRCCAWRRLVNCNPITRISVELIDPATGDRIDEVVVTYFAKPHSYTTDDVVEISCHGSPVVLRHVGGDGAGSRRTPRRTRRVHHARLPEWTHRPHAGRGRPRPHRFADALPGAGRGAPTRRCAVEAAPAHQAETDRSDRSDGSRHRLRRRRRFRHRRRIRSSSASPRSTRRSTSCSPASPTAKSCTKD